MAKNVAIGLAMMLVIVAVPTVHSHSKEITVYGLIISDGPNANVIPVAGADRPINATKFGSISVFDVPMTEGRDPGSTPVGHSQGIEVISSLDGKRVSFSSSIYFEHGEYEGSILELQGTLAAAGPGVLGELSVVGGTGSFSFVKGYARQTSFLPIPGTNNTINMLEIFLRSDHHI